MTNKQINLVKNTFDIIDIKKTESFKKKCCTLYNDKEDWHDRSKDKKYVNMLEIILKTISLAI